MSTIERDEATAATAAAVSIPWEDTIKKEARGMNDEDLGEVHEVGARFVRTQKGLISKKDYYLPKYLVDGYDGSKVYFRIGGDDIDKFERDTPPVETDVESFAEYKRKDTPADIETRIPLISERLNVSKTEGTKEVEITKEPITEMKTVQVPVTHEEVTVTRRTGDDLTTTTAGEHPTTDTETIRVPLKDEQIHVTKEPYVKEEVEVKKRAVTEQREVTDEVRGEKVTVKGEDKITEGSE